MLDLRTQTKMTRVIKALEELEIIRTSKKPLGIYLYVWDEEHSQSVAIGFFIPNDIVRDLFERVRELAIIEGMEMMS